MEDRCDVPAGADVPEQAAWVGADEALPWLDDVCRAADEEAPPAPAVEDEVSTEAVDEPVELDAAGRDALPEVVPLATEEVPVVEAVADVEVVDAVVETVEEFDEVPPDESDEPGGRGPDDVDTSVATAATHTPLPRSQRAPAG